MKNRKEKMEKINNREFYLGRSLLGNDWAMLFFMLGGRETGKSYFITKTFVHQFIKYGRPFYWIRLTDKSKKKLLNDNAKKLIDPDIRRDFKLNLMTNGDAVYVIERNEKGKIVKKELMCRVMDLSTFYDDKGSGLFDKNFLDDPHMYYNICLDEMNREKGEKKSFDIVYSFVNQIENLIRSTKKRVRIVCIGNLLDEASDLLCCLNFIPDKFGRFKLKKKRAIIEYIEENDAYKNRRKGTIADIMMPNASTFTNEIKVDSSLVNKNRCCKPTMIIKFTKDTSDWFTVWDSRVVHRWNKEKCKIVIPMRPYLDEVYNQDTMNNIIKCFDARAFLYKDLITFKLFQSRLGDLRAAKK